MTRIAVVVGSGPFGEDILQKAPWIRQLRRHEVFVASRVDPGRFDEARLEGVIGAAESRALKMSLEQVRAHSSVFESIYASPLFAKEYANRDLLRMQDYLGISLAYLTNLDPSFEAEQLRNDRLAQARVELLCRFVEFFQDFFVRHHTTVLVHTVEDDLMSVAALNVARREGVDVLGVVSGRFPQKGLMIARGFSEVCRWNSEDVPDRTPAALYDDQTIAGSNRVLESASYWAPKNLPSRLKGLVRLARYDMLARGVRNSFPHETLVFRDFSGGNLLRALQAYLTKLTRSVLSSRRWTELSRVEGDFLFFPLHYTVDAQITFREPFVDQFSLLAAISKALPAGVSLLIKPHPHYMATDIGLRDIAKIASLPNVALLNPATSPIAVIRKSKAVVTINSTTGFEALIMGAPVVTFGHDFYCRDDLCFVVRDLQRLPFVLMEAMRGVKTGSYDHIQRFVKTIFANTVWIQGIEYPNGFTGLTDEDGLALARTLDSILSLGSEDPPRDRKAAGIRDETA